MTFLAIMAFVLVRMRNLFAVVMLSGIFSLLCAGLFVVMDAVDVAFTEAAVGAGISTVLMLGALNLTSSHSKKAGKLAVGPLLIVLLTGGTLIYATFDMPHFGDKNAPIHKHKLYQEYVKDSYDKIGVPNVVTSVLASYRGYDTMGEVTVIFTAGIGVLLLLGSAGRRTKEEEDALLPGQKLHPSPGNAHMVHDATADQADDATSSHDDDSGGDGNEDDGGDVTVDEETTSDVQSESKATPEDAPTTEPDEAPVADVSPDDTIADDVPTDEPAADNKADDMVKAKADETPKAKADTTSSGGKSEKLDVAKPSGGKKSKKSKKNKKKKKKKGKKGRRMERAAKGCMV